MKKDIIVPEVKNVDIIAINEWSADFEANVWYVYLLNTLDTSIEMILVTSKAEGIINNETQNTSSLRHSYNEVSPHTAIRIEMLTEEVLALTNIFQVSYFYENQVYDKKFTFAPNAIQLKDQVNIDALMTKGIFAL